MVSFEASLVLFRSTFQFVVYLGSPFATLLNCHSPHVANVLSNAVLSIVSWLLDFCCFIALRTVGGMKLKITNKLWQRASSAPRLRRCNGVIVEIPHSTSFILSVKNLDQTRKNMIGFQPVSRLWHFDSELLTN